jgi:hypothetical protein
MFVFVHEAHRVKIRAVHIRPVIILLRPAIKMDKQGSATSRSPGGNLDCNKKKKICNLDCNKKGKHVIWTAIKREKICNLDCNKKKKYTQLQQL